MDIRQLSYFVEVAYQGSFTKAAKKINISQPALSNCIKNLEEELEVNLFIRKHGNLTLTESGKYVLEEAENLLAFFSTIQSKFSNISQQKRDFLSIGCSPLLSSIFGTNLITSFFENYENVSFSYSEEPVEQLIRKVFRMEVDIAICMICSNEYEFMDKVIVETFHYGNFIAAVNRRLDFDCEYLEEINPIKMNLVTSYELATLPIGKFYNNWHSIFYADRIDEAMKKVIDNNFVALVPNVARQYFPEDVDFVNLKEPIKYDIAFITKKNDKSSKIMKLLKKYIAMNFINSKKNIID